MARSDEEIHLSKNDQESLRNIGLLREGEYAVKISTMIFAVNVKTGDRRLLQTEGVILESSKKVLLG